MIIDYRVIQDYDTGELVQKIKDAMMAHRWQPLGGISYDGTRQIYMQAMVRYEPTAQSQPANRQS